MFVRKAGVYPSGALFRLLALPTNIRLGLKGLHLINFDKLINLINYDSRKFSNIGIIVVIYKCS